MRFPVCERRCGFWNDYNPNFGPYVIDCCYSRKISTYNTTNPKEMSRSPVNTPSYMTGHANSGQTPVGYPHANASQSVSPMNIYNSYTDAGYRRTPVSIFSQQPLARDLQSQRDTSPMQMSMESSLTPVIDQDGSEGMPLSYDETDEPISSRIRIYSRSGHVVQSYNAGTNKVTLPKSAETASIVVIGSGGTVVPFSYVPETNIEKALVRRSTGDKADVTVIKGDKTIEGKILSLGSEDVTVISDGEISNIREYDQVSVSTTEDYTRPHLVINWNSPFTISYLLSSISWSCVGTALIDNQKNMMYLRLAGNIVNNTESDIVADTVLVSGDIYQYRTNPGTRYESAMYSSDTAMVKAASRSENLVERSLLEDYTKYNVGNRTIRNKDIAELGTSSFPVIKFYIHETNGDGSVRFGYRFTATEFIPSCSLNVYSVDNAYNIDSYLGSNEIGESQKNDDIDIILGESTMLQCKSEIVVSDAVVPDEETAKRYNLPLDSFKRKQEGSSNGNKKEGDWYIITEDLKVEITNNNKNASSLILRHYVGNKKLVTLRCQTYKERKNGYIEWYFQIPPKSGDAPQKDTFTCQILTAAFR